METSCLKNDNVASAFETLIEITNNDKKKRKSIFNDYIVISKDDVKKDKNRKGTCCGEKT